MNPLDFQTFRPRRPEKNLHPEYKMSSSQKSFAQINVRGKFLKALSTATEFSFASPDSVQDVAEPQGTTGTSGQLYKDLGREIVRYDTLAAGAMKLAVYRQVQKVAGSGSEGVPASDIPITSATAIYVKVWDAAGTGVSVVRTG